jgi:hypothetical protein
MQYRMGTGPTLRQRPDSSRLTPTHPQTLLFLCGGVQGAAQRTNSSLQQEVDAVLLPCGGLPRKWV